MSGAGQRPKPEYVWAETKSRLGQAGEDAVLDEAPEFAREDLSWPLFVAFLLAHGWFLRPKAFPLGREGDKPSANFLAMKWRFLGFAAAWLAAFTLLPTAWVLAGMAVWGAIAWRGVAELNQQFQNESTGEPGPA